MHGVENNKLSLLLHGNTSPHDYALKLREVEAIRQADLIIWGGENLEFFLIKLFKQPAIVDKLLTIQNLEKLNTLPVRSINTCSHAHAHNNRVDEHIWLSPDNAKIIVQAITKALIKLDPAHRIKYLANKRQFLIKLSKMDAVIRNKLLKVIGQSYLVFHDAYQYFEKFYGLNPPLVISNNPAIPLSVHRMLTINDAIKKDQIKCLFKEPQFNSKILNSFLQSTTKKGLQAGELDPLGSDQDLGADGYFKLLEHLADQFCSCFKYTLS